MMKENEAKTKSQHDEGETKQRRRANMMKENKTKKKGRYDEGEQDKEERPTR